MRMILIIMLAGMFAMAGVALAGPDNFGGKGKGWIETSQFGVDYYQHKNTEAHTKNFNSNQGAGKRFSQPGKAEGKASGNSVILDDPMHPGTQVLPGSNK